MKCITKSRVNFSRFHIHLGFAVIPIGVALTGCLGKGGAFQWVSSVASGNGSSSLSLTKFSGDRQTLVSGTALTDPLVILVSDSSGTPVANVSVTFQSASAGSTQIFLTGSDGKASLKGSIGSACTFCGTQSLAMNAFLTSSQGSTSGVTFIVTTTATVPTVAPRYSNAPNWNQYVETASPATSCSGNETGIAPTPQSPCMHGGQVRMVQVLGESSCTGLSASDSLGVFNWNCVLMNQIPTFVNHFSAGKGLQNLINSTPAWIPNSVMLTKSGMSVSSPRGAWWSNLVGLAPDSTGAQTPLATSGKIYVISAMSSASKGYLITADQVGLVGLPGSKLKSLAGLSANCGTDHSLLCVNGPVKFLWLEGNFDGYSASSTTAILKMTQTTFSEIQNFNAANGGSVGGIYLTSGSKYNHFSSVRAMNLSGSGISLASGSSYNAFYDSLISNNLGSGISLQGAGTNYNSFVKSIVVDNGSSGISLSTSPSYNYFTQTTVSANNAGNNAAEQGAGLLITNANNNIFHQSVVSNNSIYGIYLGSSAGSNTFSQTVSADQSYGLSASSSGNPFLGNFLVYGSLYNCDLQNLTGYNLATGLTGQNCTPSGKVNVPVYTSTLTLGSSYLGLVNSQDSVNTTNSNGSYSFSSILDWFNFSNPTRAWGGPASNYFGANSGSCTEGMTCQIWDWALSASDPLLLNKSGDGLSSNSTFVANATCPIEVKGTQSLTSANGIQYLKNAVELPGTGGNDNGLCEASETCLYTPNYGAYQGHGSLDSCNYNANGGLQGIQMFGYASNGY